MFVISAPIQLIQIGLLPLDSFPWPPLSRCSAKLGHQKDMGELGELDVVNSDLSVIKLSYREYR